MSREAGSKGVPAATDGPAPGRYPISLDLRGRRVLVVGGGQVATRRIRDLLAAGARVDVVSPEVTAEIEALVSGETLRLVRRGWRGTDVTDPERAWLVQTATGVPEVDAAVAASAQAAGVWCLRADRAEASPAWRPAVAAGRQGTLAEGVEVAVTAGGDPARAVAVRDAILTLLERGRLPLWRRRTTDHRDIA